MHVASLFCQHFAPRLPDGRSWESERQLAADLIIDTVTRYAPNFRRSIVGILALSPFDLEQRFGLPSGDIFHGALGLDQLWAARPLLGYGDTVRVFPACICAVRARILVVESLDCPDAIALQ